jgi:hypothetical protein
MKRLPTVKALLICVAFLFPLNVYSYTCEELHRDWLAFKKIEAGETDRTTEARGFMYATYVRGVLDGITLGIALILAKSPEANTTLTDRMTTLSTFRQGVYIVGQWLEENPKNWKENGSMCIYMAMASIE